MKVKVKKMKYQIKSLNRQLVKAGVIPEEIPDLEFEEEIEPPKVQIIRHTGPTEEQLKEMEDMKIQKEQELEDLKKEFEAERESLNAKIKALEDEVDKVKKKLIFIF